ncbi:hypothetical protein H7171_01930 [Candidatus Saccharibacteria bacterium]|nr:hypothetical protein [Candidatus Saccharibacteria bacterium]
MHLGSTSGKDVTIYPITGQQSATNIFTAAPVALSASSVVNDKLPNSLVVAGMTYDGVAGGTGLPTAAVAFLTGDSTGSFSTGSVNGAQQFSLYALKHTNYATTDAAQMSNRLSHATANLDAAKQVQICIASDTIDQSGLITIGTNYGGLNGGLSVNLKLHSGVVCA